MNKYKYNIGVLGGTFDNFHKGHKYFIDKAFEKAEFITIGLTTNEFIKDKKLFNLIEDYKIRELNLVSYLEKKGFSTRFKILPISDFYGITLKDKNIEVIFTTKDTLENTKKINEKRLEINFPPLDVVEISLQKGNDKQTISSSRIRMGEIDVLGTSFLILFSDKKSLRLPQEFRNDFKKPIGEIVSDLEVLKKLTKNQFIILIGDIVTSTLISIGKIPNLSIFDLKTQRKNIKDKLILNTLPKPDVKLTNNPGTITSNAAERIHEFIQKSLKDKKSYALQINGEEDLLTVPAILLSPINSIVLYGQRDVGAVLVRVTLEKKKEILNKYFSKFIYF